MVWWNDKQFSCVMKKLQDSMWLQWYRFQCWKNSAICTCSKGNGKKVWRFWSCWRNWETRSWTFPVWKDEKIVKVCNKIIQKGYNRVQQKSKASVKNFLKQWYWVPNQNDMYQVCFHAREKNPRATFTHNIDICDVSEQDKKTLYECLHVWMSFVNVSNVGNFSDVGNFSNVVDFSKIGNASNVGKCKNISNISDAGIFFNIDIVRITGHFSNISIISNAGKVIYISNTDNFNNIGNFSNTGNFSNIGNICNACIVIYIVSVIRIISIIFIISVISVMSLNAFDVSNLIIFILCRIQFK